MSKTIAFEAVIGVNPGYGHKNETSNNLKIVASLWLEVAENVEAETGLYISANIMSSLTLYKTDWGCPAGGEETVTIKAVCNPEFANTEAWKQASLKVIKKLKNRLSQSTVTVSYTEQEIVYLK